MGLKSWKRNKKGEMRVIEALLACIIIISGFTISYRLSTSYVGARQAQMEVTSINLAGLLGSQSLLEKVERQEGNWQQDLKSCLESLLPAGTFYELTVYSTLQKREIANITNVYGENITAGMNSASARSVITVSLPMARNETKEVDAILILDRSGSMGERLTGDVETKITYLKDASKYFVDCLNMSTSRVGLSSFSTTARLDAVLGNNRVAVKQAIDSLVANGWTCMGGAISLASDEFELHRRVDSSCAAIIISDGVPNVDANGNVDDRLGQRYAQQEADYLASLGVGIYTIGLGSSSNFNETLLKGIQTEGYYYAPSALQLREIYDLIISDMLYHANFDIVVMTLTIMRPGNI
jgi:Mg-chelatase subunit ChlD